MKASDMREMTRGELAQHLEELYQELFNLRFQAATRQLENVGRLRTVRREIARTKTVLSEQVVEEVQ